MATQHYACTLLKMFGMLPWRRVVETTRENMSRAALHHNRVLLECCFHPWLELTRRVNEERLEAADALCKNILLRRTWRQWKKVRGANLCLSCLQYSIFHGFLEFVRTRRRPVCWFRAASTNKGRYQTVFTSQTSLRKVPIIKPNANILPGWSSRLVIRYVYYRLAK